MNSDRRVFLELLSKFAIINVKLGEYRALKEPVNSERKVRAEEENIRILHEIEKLANKYIK